MPTLTQYDFTQEVDYSSVLASNIQASSIATALDHIDTSGSGPTMAVMVWFKDVLSNTDQTTLNTVMAAYVNTAPPTTIPSVVQVLGADTLTLCPFGSIISPVAGTMTNCDIPLPTTMVLRGGVFFSPNAALGDWIAISVVDKDNVTGQGGTPTNPTVLGTYVLSWYILPNIENRLEDVSISESLPQGIYMRISYTSVGTANPTGLMNFISYVGTP
jgi:hypothetical protein